MTERVTKVSPPSKGGLYFGEAKDPKLFIPSGSKLLDLALGGGWRRRRISNVVGNKAVGKTLIAIEMCANFRRSVPDGHIYYRESEDAFDRDYAGALGMPVGSVDFGTDPLETVEDLYTDISRICEKVKATKDHPPILYICDSLDALSDEAELAREFNEGTYGANKARQMSKFFRQTVRDIGGSDVTMMFVSQIRDNMNAGPFARKWVRSGGVSLDFYASQIVFLQQKQKVKQTKSGIERVTGIDVHASLEKNKVGLPYRDCDFTVVFGYGIDDTDSCVDYLKKTKALDLLGMKETDTKHYLGRIEKANDEEYRTMIAELHAAVEKKWYEVEKSFLPERKKY